MAVLLPTLIVCAVSLGGCPATRTTTSIAGGGGGSGSSGQNTAALDADLARITALLEEGSLAEAEAEIAAAAASSSSGALAVMRGRIALDRIDLDGAAEAFAEAAASSDPAAASAGRLYVAMLDAREQDLDQAIAPLMRHLDEPNPLVATRDLPTLWLLAAEAAAAAGDTVRAVEALGEAHAEAERQTDETLAAFVAARAFELAIDAEVELTEAAWPSSRGLARAALGDRLVRARFASGDAAGAEAALLETAPALALAGELGRLAELENLLKLDGAVGGRALIGVVLPLSGDSRRVGRRMLAGILQAQGTFFPGGGRRLTVVFKDSGSDPVQAVAAVQALEAMGALAIIGPVESKASAAAAEAATQLGVPLISLALDEHGAVSAGALHFGIDVELELATLADHLVEVGTLRAIAVRPETPFGRALTDRFGALLAARGGELVETWTYEPGQSDLRRIAKDIARESFDVVFVPDTARGASLVARFLAEQNLWGAAPGTPAPSRADGRRFVTYAGPSTWYDDATELDEPERRYLDGARFAATWARQRPGDQNALFVETFEMLYERSPGLYEALAYDVTRLLRELVMNRGYAERTALRTALEQVRDREGVTGTFGFDGASASPEPFVLELRATEGVRAAPTPAAPAPPADAPASPPSPQDDALPPAVLEQ